MSDSILKCTPDAELIANAESMGKEHMTGPGFFTRLFFGNLRFTTKDKLRWTLKSKTGGSIMPAVCGVCSDAPSVRRRKIIRVIEEIGLFNYKADDGISWCDEAPEMYADELPWEQLEQWEMWEAFEDATTKDQLDAFWAALEKDAVQIVMHGYFQKKIIGENKPVVVDFKRHEKLNVDLGSEKGLAYLNKVKPEELPTAVHQLIQRAARYGKKPTVAIMGPGVFESVFLRSELRKLFDTKNCCGSVSSEGLDVSLNAENANALANDDIIEHGSWMGIRWMTVSSTYEENGCEHYYVAPGSLLLANPTQYNGFRYHGRIKHPRLHTGGKAFTPQQFLISQPPIVSDYEKSQEFHSTVIQLPKYPNASMLVTALDPAAAKLHELESTAPEKTAA